MSNLLLKCCSTCLISRGNAVLLSKSLVEMLSRFLSLCPYPVSFPYHSFFFLYQKIGYHYLFYLLQCSLFLSPQLFFPAIQTNINDN